MKIKHVLTRSGAKAISLLLSTATLLAAAPAARADSPSDLMEQGVYSEETKGDLDNAVQLYQKVIAQAKADQALAAQAQYHLGLCYYKQHNYTEANTVFQSLVKEYPTETNVVTLARKYLASVNALQPAPWANNEDMQMNLETEGGMKVGVVHYRIDAGQTTNGQNIWRCSSHLTAGGIQSVSHVEADADTFSPIHSVWKHTLLGDVEATYYPEYAELKAVGKDTVQKVTFTPPIIDNEEAVEWMRRLPLADGYTNNQSVLASLVGNVVPITWSVSGPESVSVPAGTYQCYKISLSINQTFWYSSDANRYLVKFEGGGAIAELTGVTHRSAGEKAAYEDTTNGFSMTAPAGWSFDPQEADGKSKTTVRILDPEGSANSVATMDSLDALTADQKKSLRDYANFKVTAAAKMYQDYQVRSNSWTDRTVAGQPAVSVIVDYTEAKAKKVGYGIWSFGQTNAEYFQMLTTAKDFDNLRPQFDAIVDSFKTQ